MSVVKHLISIMSCLQAVLNTEDEDLGNGEVLNLVECHVSNQKSMEINDDSD